MCRLFKNNINKEEYEELKRLFREEYGVFRKTYGDGSIDYSIEKRNSTGDVIHVLHEHVPTIWEAKKLYKNIFKKYLKDTSVKEVLLYIKL